MSAVPAIRIELLHVAGCPHVDRVRQALRSSLAQENIHAAVEERQGDYPSPTLLIDGVDVMGPSAAIGGACRLDVPTSQRILAALRGRGESCADHRLT
jgi:hypothetical protein